jgi:hypothetical protein
VVRVSRTASTPTHRLDRERAGVHISASAATSSTSSTSSLRAPPHPPPSLSSSQRSPVPTHIPVFYDILVPRIVPLSNCYPAWPCPGLEGSTVRACVRPQSPSAASTLLDCLQGRQAFDRPYALWTDLLGCPETPQQLDYATFIPPV